MIKNVYIYIYIYRDADKSLVRPKKETSSEASNGRARIQQHRDASCHQFFFLQGKAPKGINAILTETLACFFPGRAKDLSAPCLYVCVCVCVCLHGMSPLFSSDFNESLKFLNRFSKSAQISNFMKICPTETEWLYAET